MKGPSLNFAFTSMHNPWFKGMHNPWFKGMHNPWFKSMRSPWFKGMRSPRERGRPARFCLLLTILALTSCTKKEEAPASSTDTSTVPAVKVVHVSMTKLDRVDQFPGEIRAYQDVAVYPKVPGFISWIGVDRGSTVKEGDVMVRLVAPELGAQTDEARQRAEAAKVQVSQAEAQLASAKATLLEAQAQLAGDNDTYQRTKEASQIPGVVAPNDVVVLEQKVNADKEKVGAWKQNVDAAQQQLVAQKKSLSAAISGAKNKSDINDYLTIRAPFNGYVTDRNMHVGSFVGPRGQDAYPPIINVQQLDHLRIVTPVPEVCVSGVQAGARVEFTVSTHPGERFAGTIARIGNYLEQKTRTMPVELDYWNTDGRIMPGMFCEVYWPTKRKHPSCFVPSSAVNTTSTLETFVGRVNDKNEVDWVKVSRGQLMGENVEVFGDLKDGDRVTLKGDDSLKPGSKINPIE
jgi:membrane fusion protein, multidrug efflux system